MVRSHRFLIALGLGAALLGCRQQAPDAEAAAPAAADAAQPAAPAPAPADGAQSAVPEDAVLLDFRTADTTKDIPEADQQRIAALVLPAATDKAQVTSSFEGAFTSAGAREQAVVVVPEGASTIDPSPATATLAILDGDKVVATHPLDGNWQWIRKTADIDGDGVQELFLTAGWMQMGESGTSLLVASLADGKYREVETIENVALSNCQANAERPGQGKAQAVVLSLKAGKLSQERFEAPCPPATGKKGWAEDPKPGDYKPVTG